MEKPDNPEAFVCFRDEDIQIYLARDIWEQLAPGTEKLLVAIQQEKPDANVITALAYVVLAFAMLQPDDRYRLGEIFLSAFPDYAERFCGAVL